MPPRSHITDGSDPTSVALTSGSARAPSTTRDTLVMVTADWNTVAATLSRNADLAIGSLAAVVWIAVRNADAVTAARLGGSCAFICPRNKSYTVTASNTTNLTLTATEVPL